MLLEQLLDNLALRVDAFATCRVAPGWRLRLPALDWVTLHYVVEGEGKVRGPEQEASLEAGWLAVVPPHLPHVIQCGATARAERRAGDGGGPGDLPEHVAGPLEDARLEVLCGRVAVTYGGELGLFDHLAEILALDFVGDEKMRSTFRALLEEVRTPRPGSRAMASALMSESLVSVLRRLCAHADCTLPWLRALEDPNLSRALSAMVDRPEQPHTVATLADLAYLSRSAFARRFREAFGRPPIEYLRAIRLRRGAHLLRLEPRLPVGTIARRVGFDSRSQFSRAFTKFFGSSPSEFRA